MTVIKVMLLMLTVVETASEPVNIAYIHTPNTGKGGMTCDIAYFPSF